MSKYTKFDELLAALRPSTIVDIISDLVETDPTNKLIYLLINQLVELQGRANTTHDLAQTEIPADYWQKYNNYIRNGFE
jgi:hypothetical protein